MMHITFRFVSGSWDIRIITTNTNQDRIAASIRTSHTAKTWFNIAEAYSGYWHHLVMTYNGTTVKFYLDTHLKLSDSQCCYGNIVGINADVIIGHTNFVEFYYDGFFRGFMDEVKLFQKGLTAEEVVKLYQFQVV